MSGPLRKARHRDAIEEAETETNNDNDHINGFEFKVCEIYTN